MTPEERDRLGTLIELYKEQCSHGRHTEAQRQAAGTLLLTAGGALIALMGALQFSIHCAPIAGLLLGLGVFGKRFMGVFEKKWEETSGRRDFYRTEIERITGTPTPNVTSSKGLLRAFWKRTFDAVVITGIVCLLLVGTVVSVRSTHQQGTLMDRILEQVSVQGKATSTPGGNPQ